MNITAKMVKELRGRTGSGMMECKRALQDTNGDIDAAIKLMREKGKATADKKSSRIAAEGLIAIAKTEDGDKAAIVEVNCETDFVAKDTGFKDFVNNVVDLVLKKDLNNLELLKTSEYPGINDGTTVDKMRVQLIAKIGENINIRRINILNKSAENNCLGSYLHGNRIGVLIEVAGGSEDLAKDLAMHIAAANPEFVSPDDVPEAIINHEKEIYFAQAEQTGKPKEIMERMVQGKIKKFLNEISLIGQDFVKDPNKKIAKLLAEHNAKVIKFIRYQVGEGIEKKEEDFATEVMSQVRKS